MKVHDREGLKLLGVWHMSPFPAWQFRAQFRAQHVELDVISALVERLSDTLSRKAAARKVAERWEM
jgi:hypothetical protein